MHDKPITAALYVLFGLLLALAPLLAELRPSPLAAPALPTKEWAGGHRSRLWGLGCALGVLLGLTLPWWRRLSTDVTLLEAALYAAVVGVCLHLLGREAKAPASVAAPAAKRWLLLGGACLFALVCAFDTGLVLSPQLLMNEWHHWGAYIAPGEIMRDGGRIFYDFPAQYGLGPTALLAAGCTVNCWGSMYLVAGTATFALAAATLLPAAVLRFRTAGAAAVSLAAIAAAALLWSAAPTLLGTPTAMPSVSGMRFLPAAALTAVLWWSESCPALGKRWIAIGFVLAAIGVLWSPESLFMCLAVWGPHYCLRRMAGAPADRRRAVLLRSLAQLALGLALVVAGFVAIYGAAYRVLPGLRAYLIYMLFPPGPLPINWRGPVWFCIVALLLGGWTGWRLYRSEGNTPAYRRNLLLMMMAYASLSYAMGRSHDNNFLNLLPYFALLLASVIASRQTPAGAGLAGGMLASLLGLLILFNWSPWSGARLEFRGRQVVGAISFQNPNTQAMLRSDSPRLHLDVLTAALDRIQKTSPDPVEVIDEEYLNLPGHQKVWTALHGAANYVFMPHSDRIVFIQRAARRFHSKGWLIIATPQMPLWVPDLLSAYQVDQDIDFGAYHALHMAPRPPA